MRTHQAKIVIAFGALVGVVGLAAEGCGPGDTRYYCDSTGCYNCDGYGCHPVAPPPTTTCSGQSSCAANQVCTTAGCETVCSVDTDCAKGDVCKNNVCVAPTSTEPPPQTVICTSNSDCGSGQQCVGSGSWAKCEPVANVCQYSSECGAGKVCANGECLVDCSSGTTMCAAGTQCVKGVCEPTGGSQCISDAQCSGSTPKCVDGSCVPQCTTSTDCTGGEVCDNGACVTNTLPTPNCGSCNPNQQCVDGFCRYTCSPSTCTSSTSCQTSQSCLLIDVRIGYCAKDGTCRDQQEAEANCLGASDCTGGKLCISNQCQ